MRTEIRQPVRKVQISTVYRHSSIRIAYCDEEKHQVGRDHLPNRVQTMSAKRTATELVLLLGTEFLLIVPSSRVFAELAKHTLFWNTPQLSWSRGL
jgi:hypothetical protein